MCTKDWHFLWFFLRRKTVHNFSLIQLGWWPVRGVPWGRRLDKHPQEVQGLPLHDLPHEQVLECFFPLLQPDSMQLKVRKTKFWIGNTGYQLPTYQSMPQVRLSKTVLGGCKKVSGENGSCSSTAAPCEYLSTFHARQHDDKRFDKWIMQKYKKKICFWDKKCRIVKTRSARDCLSSKLRSLLVGLWCILIHDLH